MPWLRLLRSCENASTAVPPSAAPFSVTGEPVVLYTVPREEMAAPPLAVMVAPSVAAACPIKVAVGVVKVGTVMIVCCAPSASPLSVPVVVTSAVSTLAVIVRPAVGEAATSAISR